MALVNLTFDLADMLGTDFDPMRTKVWLDTNIDGDVVFDATGKKTYLGDAKATINTDGTGSFTGLLATNTAGINPTAFQYRMWVDYQPRAPRASRVRKEFGWFSLTATKDIAEVASAQYVPPTWMTTAVATLQGYVDEAEAARDAAVDISGISTPDAVVEALVKNTGGAGPLTSAALSNTFALQGYVSSVPAYGVTPMHLAKWRRALARVNARTGHARLLVAGNSKDFKSSTTPNEAPPAVLARMLTAAGIPAVNALINLTSGPGKTDPRISYGAHWNAGGAGAGPAQGGGMVATSTGSELIVINPGYAFDTVEFHYMSFTGHGDAKFYLNNVAPLTATLPGASGGDTLVKQVVTVPLGTHTIAIEPPASGGNFGPLYAVVAYDSTSPAVLVMNMSVPGSKIGDWATSVYNTDSLKSIDLFAPDLTLIPQTTNDAGADTAQGAYEAALTLVADHAQITGDTILVAQTPDDPGSFYADAVNYRNWMKALAAARGNPFIDLYARFDGVQDNIVALGFDAGDNVHLNALGSADVADAYCRTLGTTGARDGGIQTDRGWREIGAAGEPAWQNGWVDFGSGEVTAAFRKVGNRVWLRGLIKSGTIGAVAFTLPVGYRPLNPSGAPPEAFGTVGNDAAARVTVGSDGNVRVAAGSTVWTTLSGISFFTD